MSTSRSSYESDIYSVGDWQKLKLLLWKNWILQRNQIFQVVVALVFPLVFISLIVFLRLLVLPEKKPQSRYSHVPLESLVLFMQRVKEGNRLVHANGSLNIPKGYICYTPNTPENAAITQLAAAILFLNGSRAYETPGQMEKDLVDHNFLAGVEFGPNDRRAKNERFPLNLTYSLRFPSELRTQTGPLIDTWHTTDLFVRYDLSGPRNPLDPDGGVPPGYVREGFLPIQHALTLSWLSQASGETLYTLPRVSLKRFPYRAYTYDPLLLGLRQLLPFMVMLCFMYPCSVVTKSVTNEKELQLKEIMKLIGVGNWLHWIAWFVKSYLVLMAVVLLILLLFKVNFHPNVSILTYSEVLPILLFLHTYVVASICFCFMLAVFFSKASTASAVLCIVWFLTFIPYTFVFNFYDRLSLFAKLMIALVYSNTAMGMGFNIIMNFESTGLGMTMTTMFQMVSADDTVTLFYMIITLTLSSLLYLGICLYVEQIFPGNYGIARKWNFLLHRQFWSRSEPTPPIMKKAKSGRKKHKVGIQLINLQKTYGKFRAVKGLNLKMYRDEITVLLGHNGAGKTTTLHMLTGIISPTAGTALINGYDIRTQMDKARQSLGICPQNNILFMKMSVRDHIVFFSKLKGIRGRAAINREVSRYVGILGLEAKSKVAAENLSGGMKRKLALCCAMCGNARVVLCDEPSSGIDAAGRKSLWELLQSEKQGRTVLLTTHYMDEADVLGDRIAILSNGRVQCHGTSFFLKKRYGTGYQLVCIMLSNCDVDAVTQLINRHIPHLEPERKMGTELTYRLPHHESTKFADLLADLDRNRDNLKLSGYGLSVATLEDVFMEVNSEKRLKGGAEEYNTSVDFQTLVFDTDTRENHAVSRCFMTIYALLLKKVLVTFRSHWLMVMQILLPVVILMLTIFNIRGSGIHHELPAMEISPFQYKSSYVVMEDKTTSHKQSPAAKAYESHMARYGKRSHLLSTGNKAIEDYILGLGESWNHRLDYEFVAGVTIDGNDYTVWLNNKPLHTAPLTLNLLHNAMARQYLGREAGTYVTNKPLPYSDDTRVQKLNKGNRMGFEFSVNLTLCMCFVSAFFAIPIIRERETRAKLLQFLSGVDAVGYWATMFLWDYLIFLASALMAILTLAAFQETGYSTFVDLGRYYAILMMYGLAALPVSYALASWYSDPATGFVRIAIINLASGCALYTLYTTLSIEAFHLQDVAKTLSWYFRIFPHYCLASAACELNLAYNIRTGCDSSILKRVPKEEKCKKIPLCCNIPGYFAWKNPGVLPEIVYILMVAICVFIYLIIADSRIFETLSKVFGKLCTGSKKRSEGGASSTENQDVVDERLLVRELIRTRRKEIPLLVNNIRKKYRKKLAVKGVSFHVASAECFGLLGINGAGKTSVFKMLTGDSVITSGVAYVDGINVTTQMRKARHKIGYCPQFDALFEDLTGRENLRIYCLLRGIQRHFVADISWTLARAFGFSNHLDKRTKNYSGGNKRKLSTAIAILGNPSVVFLDEPTSGMDPGARRSLWGIIGLIRMAGKSLVLTSHSMDECEALCTRLTIMVDGEFQCIGSTQSLKNQFSKGLILKIKVKHKKKTFQRIIQRSSSSSANPEIGRELDDHSRRVTEEIKRIPDEGFSHRILAVNTFILNHIQDAELKDLYNGLLTYYMPQKQSLSEVFRLIESNQKKLYIEDYLITQTRLEEIFLDFALNCEYREADVAKKKFICC